MSQNHFGQPLAYLQAIVESADDAIISQTLDGIVTSWNRGAEKLFGYTAAEMIGKPVAMLIPEDQPDEEPKILARIRRGEKIDHYEAKRRHKDGHLIEVSLTVSPIRDDSGKIVGASKIARDITDRRRLENAIAAQSFLGAIVESADDAIVSKNLDGIITSWNRGAEKLFGYKPEEIIGSPVLILIPEKNRHEEPYILDKLKRGERIEHYETQRQRKDGRIIDVSLTVSPIRMSDGRIIGASKIARDITDRKRVEASEREALREAYDARKLAEAANRAKDEFIATVSHELRTPLTAILGWIRMLTSGQLDAETQKHGLQVIDRNIRSQAQLIEDLLDVSRIVSGKLRMNMKPIEFPPLIASAVEAVQPAADAKGILIKTILDSEVGVISGNNERLQQVVWNLVFNAIKFTPSGGQVEILLEKVDSKAEFSVSDNGIGITPDYLPYVFDQFSQADSSITRARGGLGMGLAISKSIVELHGGTIAVASPGQDLGATFTVRLPLSAVKGQRPRQRAEYTNFRTEALEAAKQLEGLRILVVDDDPDTCEMLQMVLARSGAIVEIAVRGADALKILDAWPADVIVSDIGMPETDGFDFIRRVRDAGFKTPAIALTALARIEDRIKALSCGYQMHVAKPVEPSELISIVSSLSGIIVDRPQKK